MSKPKKCTLIKVKMSLYRYIYVFWMVVFVILHLEVEAMVNSSDKHPVLSELIEVSDTLESKRITWKDSLAKAREQSVFNTKTATSTKKLPRIVKTIPAHKNTRLAKAPFVFHIPKKIKKRTPGEGKYIEPIQYKIEGTEMSVDLSNIHEVPAPRYRDVGTSDIQYFDDDRGVFASYIMSILKDSKERLWFGSSTFGVSVYDGKYVTNISTLEGLSSDLIFAISEDSSGNIWFGTYGEGIIKYDGQTFTQYFHEEILNIVYSIAEDDNQNIWFATQQGVCKYDGESFAHYNQNQGLSHYSIDNVYKDSKGNMWFGTNGKGVSKFDGTSFITLAQNEGLPEKSIRTIFEDNVGDLWFGTWGAGVFKFDGETIFQYTLEQGLGSDVVNEIYQDQNGATWFATRGAGLNKFDGKSFTYISENEGLNNNRIISLEADGNGSLWLGTSGGGINRLKMNSFVTYTQKEGLSENIVYTTVEDNNENIWFGIKDGGAIKYDGHNFTHIEFGFKDQSLRSFLKENDNALLFMDDTVLTRYDGQFYAPLAKVADRGGKSMIKDAKGNVWIGTEEKGLFKYNEKSLIQYSEKEGLSSNRISSLFEDSNGNIWIGTDDRGVNKYNGKTFVHYTQTDGLANNQVLSIVEDEAGQLWIGTGGGVSLYDGKGFVNITEKEGLFDNRVRSIVEDENNNIWISSTKGISVLVGGINRKSLDDNYSNIDLDIRHYGKMDGLKGIDFIKNSAYIDGQNRFWLGSNKSLVMLDLDAHSISSSIPKPQVTSIELGQEYIDFRGLNKFLASTIEQGDSSTFHKHKDIIFSEVEPFYNYPKNLKLPYDINHLTFKYAAIDWVSTHNIRYQFILEGYDEIWTTGVTENKAEYRNLPFGKFAFKLRSKGVSGVWSDPFEYAFTIHPPWWHTWWARLFFTVAGLLFALFIIKIYQKRMSTIRKHNIQLKETITQRKAIQKEKEKLIRKLEVKNAEMERFTYTVSHDLKSPLITIKGFLGMLEKDIEANESDNVKSDINFIKRATDSMNALLHQLLELSRVGNVVGKHTNHSIEELVDRAMENAKGQIEEANVKVTKHNLSLRLNCDKDRMVEVFQNLIDNAVKFRGNQKKPVIEINTIRTESGLTCSVKDNGLGVEPKYQNKIFKLFERLDAFSEGSGAGLAIVKRIVEAHSGTIVVESKGRNSGSKFNLHFPAPENIERKNELQAELASLN